MRHRDVQSLAQGHTVAELWTHVEQWGLIPCQISVAFAKILRDGCESVNRCQRPKGGLSAPTVLWPRNTDPSSSRARNVGGAPLTLSACQLHGWLLGVLRDCAEESGRRDGQVPHFATTYGSFWAVCVRTCRAGGAVWEEGPRAMCRPPWRTALEATWARCTLPDACPLVSPQPPPRARSILWNCARVRWWHDCNANPYQRAQYFKIPHVHTPTPYLWADTHHWWLSNMVIDLVSGQRVKTRNAFYC